MRLPVLILVRGDKAGLDLVEFQFEVLPGIVVSTRRVVRGGLDIFINSDFAFEVGRIDLRPVLAGCF